ncbi:hypothetical protein HDU87_006141 [Geranomyces variabilis]|uniref:DNA recombination and repair protein Rad51-like C-terminal domain-containing protein n=1 Tax=Geranomyces variabilis TaxID=109894 RepID=A0AAD5TH40_9FUNG|nr:hypothetical protein HDU87_006141 [Geranomyces variabilis]
MHANSPPPPPPLQQPQQRPSKSPPLLLATPPALLAAVQGESALNVLAQAWRGTPVFDARACPRDDPLPRVRTGELLDLCGPLGGGKTELIMRIITLTLLPQIWTPPTHPASAPPLHLGGSNSSVLLLDSDLRFSLLALDVHLRAHVIRCLPTDHHPPSDSAINVLISSALTRLHLARPSSATALLATLARAPHTFLPNAASLAPLIVVDGLSPFYWNNRLDDLGEGPHLDPADDEDEEDVGCDQPQPQPQSFMHESVHRAIIRVLRALKDDHHCAIIVSRWELFPSSSAPAGNEPGGSGGGPALARYSDAPWAALADRFCYVWRDSGGRARWKKV